MKSNKLQTLLIISSLGFQGYFCYKGHTKPLVALFSLLSSACYVYDKYIINGRLDIVDGKSELSLHLNKRNTKLIEKVKEDNSRLKTVIEAVVNNVVDLQSKASYLESEIEALKVEILEAKQNNNEDKK